MFHAHYLARGSSAREKKEQELATSTIFQEPASSDQHDYSGFDIVKATQVSLTGAKTNSSSAPRVLRTPTSILHNSRPRSNITCFYVSYRFH